MCKSIFSEFLEDMKRAQKGHIVNISSINEKSSRPGMAVYGGSKQFWAGEIIDVSPSLKEL